MGERSKAFRKAGKFMTNEEIIQYYDYLIGMDSANIRNMNRIAGGDPEEKMYKLLTFAGSSRDVADPWYTGNFDETYDDIAEGCEALMQRMTHL